MSFQRAQILLDPWQHVRLKELARQRHTTISQLVRQMVQKGLEETMGPPRRLIALARRGDVQDGEWDATTLDEELYDPGA